MKAIWKYFFVVFFIIHYGLNRLVIFDERLLVIATVMSVLSNNWKKECDEQQVFQQVKVLFSYC